MNVGVAKWACRLHRASRKQSKRDGYGEREREREKYARSWFSFATVACKSACLDFYIIKLRQLVHSKRLPIDSLTPSPAPFSSTFHTAPSHLLMKALYYHFRLEPAQKHCLPGLSWPLARFSLVQLSSAGHGSYRFASVPRTPADLAGQLWR